MGKKEEEYREVGKVEEGQNEAVSGAGELQVPRVGYKKRESLERMVQMWAELLDGWHVVGCRSIRSLLEELR